MPIKLGRIPQGVRSGGDTVRDGLADPLGGTTDAAFQRAKVSASRWTRSGIEKPDEQNAPPWFVGRPFTVSRTENSEAYKSWDGAFRRSYVGWEFGAPPPESSADSQNNEVKPQPFSDSQEEG